LVKIYTFYFIVFSFVLLSVIIKILPDIILDKKNYVSKLNIIQSKMTDQSNIKLRIAIKEPDAEELDKFTRNLLQEMRDWDIENAELVAVKDIPEGGKAFGGFLAGILAAEVNTKNIKAVLGNLRDRLSNKIIELEVEANGKKLKVKASSQQELLTAIQAAEKFIA
jgi:hypothetical protein